MSSVIATIHGKDLVDVTVLRPIASGGVAIRPIETARGKGKAPILTPVPARMPRDLAEAFGPAYVKMAAGERTKLARAPKTK